MVFFKDGCVGYLIKSIKMVFWIIYMYGKILNFLYLFMLE